MSHDLAATAKPAGQQLILAVIDHSPRSNRARANLSAYLKKHDIDIAPTEIDLLTCPEQIVQMGIFASPALIFQDQQGKRFMLYGDLSEVTALERFLEDCLSYQKCG